jgi:hypothetical protein
MVVAGGLAAVTRALRARDPGSGEADRSHRLDSLESGYLLWLVLPVASAWFVSEATGDSIFGSSFLLPVLPPALLLFAAGVSHLDQRWFYAVGTVAAAALSLSVLLPV